MSGGCKAFDTEPGGVGRGRRRQVLAGTLNPDWKWPGAGGNAQGFYVRGDWVQRSGFVEGVPGLIHLQTVMV